MKPYGDLSDYRRAFTVKKHNAYVQAWAADGALKLAALFWSEWKDVEKRLPRFDGPMTSADGLAVRGIVDAVARGKHSAFVEAVGGIQLGALMSAYVSEARRFGIASRLFPPFLPGSGNLTEAFSPFGFSNSKATAYVKAHAGESVDFIEESTRKDIERIIVRMIENGEDYETVAEEIATKFKQYAVPVGQPRHIPNRATLIAVTEAANAYCAGTIMSAEQLEDWGVPMMKFWQTVEDSRVSDGCRHNQREGWKRLAEPFESDASVGGGHQRPPRFPSCRCDILTAQLDERALGKDYSAWESLMDEPVDVTPPTETWAQMIPGSVDSTAPTETALSLEKSRKAWEGWLTPALLAALVAFRKGEETPNLKKAVNQAVTVDDFACVYGFDGDEWDEWEPGEVRRVRGYMDAEIKPSQQSTANRVYVYVEANDGKGAYIGGDVYLLKPGNSYRLIDRTPNEMGGWDFWLALL